MHFMQEFGRIGFLLLEFGRIGQCGRIPKWKKIYDTIGLYSNPYVPLSIWFGQSEQVQICQFIHFSLLSPPNASGNTYLAGHTKPNVFHITMNSAKNQSGFSYCNIIKDIIFNYQKLIFDIENEF